MKEFKNVFKQISFNNLQFKNFDSTANYFFKSKTGNTLKDNFEIPIFIIF